MDLLDGLGRGVGELAARALDLALPALCAGCGREGEALCRECRPALDARLRQPPGMPVGLPGDIPAPLAQIEWCSSFTGVTRRALHRLKYEGDRRLAAPAGRAVGRRWRRAGVGGDVLVPVPASPDRVRDRGYDQAELIARAASGICGLPVRTPLMRTRMTIAQFDLDRRERAGNVADAFAVRDAWGMGRLVGAWIILVDDVMTTGATLAACGRVLLEEGALAVSAITVARER